MLALTLSAVSCTTAPAPRPVPSRPGPAAGVVAVPGALATRVVESAYSMLDTPYRFSGADPRGFDCSGLTRYVFAAAGVELPRTAADQAGAGSWVALDELSAGDLVFFAQTSKPSHVGVVVSARGEPLRMIHASSSRGVVETEVLRDGYWLSRLKFGRRVLP